MDILHRAPTIGKASAFLEFSLYLISIFQPPRAQNVTPRPHQVPASASRKAATRREYEEMPRNGSKYQGVASSTSWMAPLEPPCRRDQSWNLSGVAFSWRGPRISSEMIMHHASRSIFDIGTYYRRGYRAKLVVIFFKSASWRNFT